MAKRILILGSTGSIGTQALDIIERMPEEFTVAGLAAGSNVPLLAEQARRFRPEAVAMADPQAAEALRQELPALAVFSGNAGVEALCRQVDADMALVAVVGIAGLPLVLACLEAGIQVALANKEALVTGGHLVMPLAASLGLPVLPVDSEHSAVFQCLMASRNPQQEVRRLILTASGGPFFGRTREELAHVTVQQALRHPNWSMGAKVTLDSASLVNKGLEVIEAHYLFAMEPAQIGVLVHPQSIVHSMVEYRDGAIMAQLSPPDMRLPIQLALAYPRRLPGVMAPLDLTAKPLTFHPVDSEAFPALGLAYRALEQGQGRTIVYNAADEVAVEAFQQGKIGFLDIPRCIEAAMESVPAGDISGLEGILDLDQRTRRFVRERIGE